MKKKKLILLHSLTYTLQAISLDISHFRVQMALTRYLYTIFLHFYVLNHAFYGMCGIVFFPLKDFIIEVVKKT